MHSVDAKKVAMKVDFKIGLINSRNENVIDVKFAWEVKDVTFPLKRTRFPDSQGHLSNVFTPCVFSRSGEKYVFCVDWHQPPRRFYTT